MVLGHLGVALGLKAWVERKSGAAPASAGPGLGLAPWFAAVMLADLGCFALAFFGVEVFRYEAGFTRHFPYRLLHAPYTHSFLGSALLGIAFALAWAACRTLAGTRAKDLRIPAAALALGVFSHAPLDWIVHGPDMAWAFEPPALGLSLWNYPEISATLEVLMLSAGTCLALQAQPGLMHWRFKTMLGILLIAGFIPALTPPIQRPDLAAVMGFLTISGLVALGWWGGRVPVAPVGDGRAGR